MFSLKDSIINSQYGTFLMVNTGPLENNIINCQEYNEYNLTGTINITNITTGTFYIADNSTKIYPDATIGPQGNLGTTGLQGPIGVDGNQGFQGSIGFQGPIGTGKGFNIFSYVNSFEEINSVITSNNNVGEFLLVKGGDLYVYYGNNNGNTGPNNSYTYAGDITDESKLIGIQGSAGTNGSQGSQGFQGAVGSAGSNGVQGFQGLVGSAGTNGSQGSQGFQGAVGSAGSNGVQGFQGLVGSAGYNGSQGSQGFQGAVGSAGSNGVQGNQGFQGVVGTDGFQGVVGNQGNQGNQGFQGTFSSTGNNHGDIIFWNSFNNNWTISNDKISIGQNAGFTGQTNNCIAIGSLAGQFSQGTNGVFGALNSAISIGTSAGRTNQSANSIAIGCNAGSCNQSYESVAIGRNSGQSGQGNNSIAIGTWAGQSYQGNNSLAIGLSTGRENQKDFSLAIGYQAGSNNQGTGCIAIGFNSGLSNQRQYSVSIGYNAGFTSIGENSIIISGGLTGLSSSTANACYISPIRNVTQSTVLGYDITNKEITYYNSPGSTFNLLNNTTFAASPLTARIASTGVWATTNATVSGAGAISCLSVNLTSDYNRKTEIETLDFNYINDLLLKLNPVSYKFKNDLENKRMGFIAQDVGEIINSSEGRINEKMALVSTDKTSINYIELISPIVLAIKDLYKKYENLEKYLNK